MPRSGEDARRRLRQATLELFGERGYDATTTAEIAARAGVTERTFFRHFPDKREALFDGDEEFCVTLGNAVLAAPKGVSPMGALLWAFHSVERTVEGNRSFNERRQQVVSRTPALQERVLTKTALVTNALAEALRRRGVKELQATLAAQVGVAAFAFAATAWLNDPEPGLHEHLTKAFDEVRRLSKTVR